MIAQDITSMKRGMIVSGDYMREWEVTIYNN